MDITFGETFDKVRELFSEPDIENNLTKYVEAIAIIRDIYGKIRVFIEPQEEVKLAEEAIENCHQKLAEKLGSYYGEDIWLPEGEGDGYKALIEVIKEERVPAEWDDATVSPRWYILERHVAKHAWTTEDAGNPPWPQEVVYAGHQAAVVSFFSFKGGVGRTTALVATALTLARNGHRVAMVDLDLEAPGLAAIFPADTGDNTGVIDYLLEKRIQKNWRLATHLRSLGEQALRGEGEPLRLLPAGYIDEKYLEKLARLDVQNLVDKELAKNLRGMLKELASAAGNLDVILLDARAGFHDLGGLAIANLSHAAVVFGTQSRQSWAGLTQVFRRLARPLADEPLPVLLIHSMAPGLGTREREPELQEFREKAYSVFQENYYISQDRAIPNSNDREAPFWPVVLEWQSELRREIALFPLDSSLGEASRVSGLVSILTGSPYQELASRLCRIVGRNLKKENEENEGKP
ncbi:MAG: AAA family ATPase [Oscillatoria sp. SIO1A7]|nr:AAA family ATPase [Oscillatoria sp. SIO1A7]